MNQDNQTVVTPEMLKRLRDLGIDTGYQPVPDFLTSKAKELLAEKEIAEIDGEMKDRLANLEAKFPRLK